MPSAIATFLVKFAVATTGITIGGVTAAGLSAGFIIGSKIAATIAALAITNAIQKSKLKDLGDATDMKRDVNIRSATEARKIVYGECLVGGVVVYSNTHGSENEILTTVIAHAGHEVNDMLDVYLDANKITDAQIGSGAGANSGMQGVTSGKYFINSLAHVNIDRRTGTTTQASNSSLISFFSSDWDSNDRGREIAYTVIDLSLYEASAKVFEAGAPRDYKCLIQGKKLYNPAADSSAGADMIANGFDSGTYKSYSTNPVLAAIDYMIDDRLGMAIDPSNIEWDVVVDEAAFCDAQVYGSGGTAQARFVCNGVLSTYDTHKTNLQRILSCCNGSIAYRNGKWFVKVGRYGEGANLVTNGTFANLTGWTEYGSGTAAASGQLTLTANAGASKGVYRSLGTVTDGAKYYAQVYCGNIAANMTARISVYTGTAEGGTLLGAATLPATADDSYVEVEFVASGTAAYIHLEAENSSGGGAVVMDNAECYLVATETLTADWMRDTVGIQTSLTKPERFNGARGFYFSKDETYKQVQSLEVTSAINLSRDNQEVLFREMNLPMTNTEDEAQRILYKLLKANERQVRLTVPANYLALDLAVHDRVMVTVSELSYTQKVFYVESWSLADNQGGVDLVLVEDSIDNWRDPDENDYSTRTATGAIDPATPEVPPPTSVELTARTGLPDITISWNDPNPSDFYDYAQVFRHTSNTFGAATLLVDTRANTYTDSTAIAGTTYYYWVRSRKGNEFSTEVATNPTNSTAAQNVADQIQWSGVLDGAGTKPDDNATVGGTFGTDVKKEDGSTTVDDLDAINDFILTKGLSAPSLNFNPFLDIARDDDTPAGFYVGTQTGSVARSSIIQFENANKNSMKIVSGKGAKIVTAAHSIQSGFRYELAIRCKGDASTFLNIELMHLDNDDIGSGKVALCTSPNNADSEVATATRAVGGLAAGTLVTVGTSYNTTYKDLGFPYLLNGVDVTSVYDDVVWCSFAMFINTGTWTDTNIYIDTFSVYPVATSYAYTGTP